MTPYYQDDMVTLYHGDCLDVLLTLPDASVDSVVTDPPYDLTAGKKGGTGAASVNLNSPYERSRIGTGNGAGGFMGKAWDATGIAFDADTWRAVMRVLKPGGHLLAFGGTRTWHRLAVAVEDAGFEMRDSIAWLYGSGFPKSLDVSKAIDKAAGATREVTGTAFGARNGNGQNIDYGAFGSAADGTYSLTAPATPDAERWQGWGTALKPAFEPVVVARKPLIGTVAANVLAHGTGALNIDGCRVEGAGGGTVCTNRDGLGTCRGHANAGRSTSGETFHGPDTNPAGRWPANVVLDQHAAAKLDEQSGESVSKAGGSSGTHFSAGDPGVPTPDRPRGGHDDRGGASRFFYVAKAPTSERPRVDGIAHPTVKPLDLMRWLVRLVTPPGGTVLEPFAGSGTTAEACVLEGFQCVAIEREADYLPLITSRLGKPVQLGLNLEWPA